MHALTNFDVWEYIEWLDIDILRVKNNGKNIYKSSSFMSPKKWLYINIYKILLPNLWMHKE